MIIFPLLTCCIDMFMLILQKTFDWMIFLHIIYILMGHYGQSLRFCMESPCSGLHLHLIKWSMSSCIVK